MDIYLPIAQMSVDIFLLIGLGVIVGLISGLLGIGGAFLLVPILIFIGISPAVAVASQVNQIAASSFSAALEHRHHHNVDLKMGLYLLIGGLLGSTAGVGFFALLKTIGQINFFIPLAYVVFLGCIGAIMLTESIRTMRHRSKDKEPGRLHRLYKPLSREHLPFRVLFRRSRVYASILLPIVIGCVAGILSALLGIGGGLILVPAMIYLLKMPTHLAIGTSTFQMFLIALNVTLLQATFNHTVDILLAFLLMMGGVVGAQIGATYSTRLKAYVLRLFLAVIVLIIGLRMAINLFTSSAAKITSPTSTGETHFVNFIADFAHNTPFLYGITCCILALVVGWLANSIFKKIKSYRHLAE